MHELPTCTNNEVPRSIQKTASNLGLAVVGRLPLYSEPASAFSRFTASRRCTHQVAEAVPKERKRKLRFLLDSCFAHLRASLACLSIKRMAPFKGRRAAGWSSPSSARKRRRHMELAAARRPSRSHIATAQVRAASPYSLDVASAAANWALAMAKNSAVSIRRTAMTKTQRHKLKSKQSLCC